jgi:hypothetical protein
VLPADGILVRYEILYYGAAFSSFNSPTEQTICLLFYADMTPNEFRELLASTSDSDLLGPCLHNDEIPFVFDSTSKSWDQFRKEIVIPLGLAVDDIRVVGSGRMGFSTKPGMNLREFRDKSDVDVAIVNAELFDWIWVSLLQIAYPRPPVSHKTVAWLTETQRGVYTGFIQPLELQYDLAIYGNIARPLADFRSRWFTSLKESARFVKRRHEDVKGRLYRTWQHAELYHLDSLKGLRKTLAR